MHVSIEMVHERHNRTSVKEQIQLTKGFIAAEKENRFNPGSIHPPSSQYNWEKTRSHVESTR